MIDVSKNIIHSFISEKGCKEYAKTPYMGLSDKQISSVYTDYLKHKNKKENFYFTKNTVERISKMDISKVYPETLSFLGEKYHKEFSFCFLERENISFCFTVDINSVKFIVFNGTRNTVRIIAKEGHIKNTFNYNGFEKAIVGSAIINFPLNELTIIPANPLYFLEKKQPVTADYYNDLMRAGNNPLFLKELQKDYTTKSDLIFLAIKAFVFLKTASVIDKTFITDNKKIRVKNKLGFAKRNDDITVINSFYDESIHVLNPFAVSGHFRNQPYKNKVEVIYIDSFMKKGYKRPAKILSQTGLKNE